MAERTSPRAASRRITPQPAPQPARTTRITRSQSRDVSDSEEGRNRHKIQRGAKQKPSMGANSGIGGSRPKGSKQKMSNQAENPQDLSTVAEESIVYPDLTLNRDHHDMEEQELDEMLHIDLQPKTQSKSPGGVSAFSGTTARTSRSAQDLSDLNAETLLDAFLDLSHTSDKLLKFLMPLEISEASVHAHMAQLQTKPSPANKNFNRLATTLSAHKDMYGSESYIGLQEVLQTLVGSNHELRADTGPWRPDAVIEKANLAVMASRVFMQSLKSQDAQVVEELEQAFPSSFIEEFVASEAPRAGDSQLVDQTFELALAIRTQYAIMMLARYARESNFDTGIVIAEIFLQNGKTLRGWDIPSLRTRDLNDEAKATALSRVQIFLNAFARSEEDPIAGIEHLQSRFPWSDFVLQSVAWIDLRLKELDRQISACQGVDRVFEALQVAVQSASKASMVDDGQNGRGSPPIVLEYDPPSEMADEPFEHAVVPAKTTAIKKLKLSQFNANSPKARGVLSALKRIEANHNAGSTPKSLSRQQNRSDVQVTASAGPSTRVLESQSSDDESTFPSTAPAKIPNHGTAQHQEEDNWQPQAEDDDLPLAASDEERGKREEQLTQVARKYDAVVIQQQAESNKENIHVPMTQPEAQPARVVKRRLIDSQDNAQRLNFNDDEELDRVDQSSQVEDPTEDEGFQTQQVATRTGKRKTLKPASRATAPMRELSQLPSPKRPRTQHASTSGSPRITQDRLHDEPPPSAVLNQRQRVSTSVRPRVTQDRPDDEPPPSAYVVEYKAANNAAKELKAFIPKPTQARVPWSEAETERFIMLIEEHGTGWAQLLREDNGEVLHSRNQIQLKDKARNMKTDYLKAGRMLPKNFEKIAISKLQRDSLAALGIEYNPETGRRKDAISASDDE